MGGWLALPGSAGDPEPYDVSSSLSCNVIKDPNKQNKKRTLGLPQPRENWSHRPPEGWRVTALTATSLRSRRETIGNVTLWELRRRDTKPLASPLM